MKRYASFLVLFVLLWPAESGAAWIAKPGTVKVFARKKPRLAGFGLPQPDLPLQGLRDIGADIVEDQDEFLVLQVALPNASASPRILANVADVIEIRNELDLLQFRDMPVDAREPVASYPSPWERQVALPPPARDAFVLQFATVPRSEWLSDMRAAGVTILDYVPQNGYVVLGDSDTLKHFADRLPVQLLRLHQPYHKMSDRLRDTAEQIDDVTVSIASVPEAAEATALLGSNTLAQLAPPDASGDRTYYRVALPVAVLPQLAALPAVLWIELYRRPTPSGQREAHLTLGDTLVSNVGGVLAPALGGSRQWIASKVGACPGSACYKTALKMAILDTGFDIGDPVNVHPDFKDSAGNSFITLLNYTNSAGSNADCYGHGTFVAGVLAGNAGVGVSTMTRDAGSDGNYLMGLGVLPEMPLIIGRVFSYLPGVTPSGFDPWRPLQRIYGDLASRGVSITSNSFNNDSDTSYSADAATYDQLVRSPTGQNGGSQMTIYFSGGNNEANVFQQHVSNWATAKNVIGVGGSENFNPNVYPDPPFNPPATKGTYSDNGNQIWVNESMGPTTSDGRIKPDLVAPASAIESPESRQSIIGCQGGPVGTTIDGGMHYWSRGTSFSAPLAAGAGALLFTWFKSATGTAPVPALLKAMQITLAYDLSGTGHPPDAAQGWGKVDLTRAFATDGRYWWDNEGTDTLLTTVPGHQTAYLPNGPGTSYRIKDTSKPVRVTLVWTDYPGNPGTGPALVNDLDLTVRMFGSGNGKYALGNDFNAGTGRSNVRNPGGGGTSDNRNNVEQIVFTYADAGADHFSVEVFAKTLANDGINVWSPIANQQNFALFIENAVANQNNAAFVVQTAPTSVAAGATYSASFTFQNTGNTAWSEGPNDFYRLGYFPQGNPNPWGSRLILNSGETINPLQSKTFSLSITAPYAVGSYPLQWQMLEELVQWFGPTSTPTNVAVTASPTSFYTLTPCRIVDTRGPTGTYGAPALVAGAVRSFPIRGQCAIPNTAKAVSANLTVVVASGQGSLNVYPANIAAPLTSVLNYRAGQTRANNAVVTLDTGGNLIVQAAVAGTDFVLDVNGYFQ
jgi:hypothetical protein